MAKLYIQLKTEGETRFSVVPGQTVIVDLGEVENTAPNPLPLPPLEIRHSANVRLKATRKNANPDDPKDGVLVQYEFTNDGREAELVVIREVDVALVQRA